MPLGPISLGVVNRLAASVTIPLYTSLSVTAQFLAKPGIRLAPEGDTTKFIEMMTGVVPSPEPYVLMTATIALAKTLSVSAAYQAQMQLSTILGQVTIRPDVTRGSGGLQPFVLQDAALMRAENMDFGGDSAEFGVVIRGSWYINSALWSGLIATTGGSILGGLISTAAAVL